QRLVGIGGTNLEMNRNQSESLRQLRKRAEMTERIRIPHDADRIEQTMQVCLPDFRSDHCVAHRQTLGCRNHCWHESVSQRASISNSNRDYLRNVARNAFR